MYLKLTNSNIENIIHKYINLQDIERLNLKIIFTLDYFKKNMANICKKLKETDDYIVILEILNTYLKNISNEDFINIMNQKYEAKKTDKEIRSFINNKHDILEKLCKNIKFIIFLLSKLDDNNLLHKYIKDIILNKKYGILKRISTFFHYIYKTIFFLNMIQLICIKLNENQLITYKEKSNIFFKFLRYHINITNLFDCKFLQVEMFTDMNKINSLHSFEEYNKEYIMKSNVIIDSINEIIFGIMKNELSYKDKSNENSILNYDFFLDSNNFNQNLATFINNIFIIIKLFYPEEDMLFINRYLDTIEEKYMTNDNYLHSEYFIQDFINGFFKYIAISSLTSPLDFPEIFGKLTFNFPIINILKNNFEYIDELDVNLYYFIKTESNTDIYQILNKINKKKLVFLFNKLLQYRLNNTIFKIFNLYKSYLSRSISELITIFYK